MTHSNLDAAPKPATALLRETIAKLSGWIEADTRAPPGMSVRQTAEVMVMAYLFTAAAEQRGRRGLLELREVSVMLADELLETRPPEGNA